MRSALRSAHAIAVSASAAKTDSAIKRRRLIDRSVPADDTAFLRDEEIALRGAAIGGTLSAPGVSTVINPPIPLLL
jgi:hypothetical protein